MRTGLSYTLVALLITLSLFACRKTDDCADSTVDASSPLTNARFRIIDTAGRDLLASQTPGKLSFDKLYAHQPCNKVDTLNKNILQIGAGGLEGYVFYFNNLYQPIPDEAANCYTLQLNWGDGGTDVIRFNTRAEHGTCGVSYFLDGLSFNGYDVKQDGNGYYVLQRR